MKLNFFRKKANKHLLAEAVVETEEVGSLMRFPSGFKKHILTILAQKEIFVGGGALVIASFIANILNYFFNAYLGRILTYEQFSLIGLIGGFLSFATIFFGAYSLTFNYSNSFLIGRYGDAAGYSHWKHMQRQVLIPSLVAAGIWLLITPFLMNFFHTSNALLFILFSLVLLVGFVSSINQGFLAAKLLFGALAAISLVDPLVKLTVTFSLAGFGLQTWAFAAIPTSALIVFVAATLLIKKQVKQITLFKPLAEVKMFSKRFFFASLLTAFSSISYFTIDIFLAKHFLSGTDAGKYALISLVGKMIFFLGNLTSPFIIPLASRSEGARKNSLHTLYLLVLFTSLFAFVGFILFGVFGALTVPILYGSKAQVIVPNLLYYTFGMMCYTVSMVLINYYLVRKIYTFTVATSLLIFLQIMLIVFFHNNVATIANVMAFVLVIHLTLSVSLHLLVKKVMVFENNAEKIILKYRKMVVKSTLQKKPISYAK